MEILTLEPIGPRLSGVSTVAARVDHVHLAVGLSDTTETQGVLPLSRGGTGSSLSPVVGAALYSVTAHAFTSAGTIGQVLLSNGPSIPSWDGTDGGNF